MFPIELVREFHLAFGLPVTEKPGLPKDEERWLRYNLLREEFLEYVDAEDNDNLVEIADALGDMLYVIYGTCLSYGIPIEEVFNAIHESNMSKLDEQGKPVYNELGKIMKPECWNPPNIKEILNAHS